MREISTEDAPPSIGPFSQAIAEGDRVYVSGQGPIDPETEAIVGDDAAAQTERTLDNVAAILRATGCSLDDVLKAKVYGERMSEPYPARSAVEVVRLPVDIDVEIEVVATTAGR